MIKVTEYEKHAEECRQMARQTSALGQETQLEEMAQAWEALARDRAEQEHKRAIAQAAETTPINGVHTTTH